MAVLIKSIQWVILGRGGGIKTLGAFKQECQLQLLYHKSNFELLPIHLPNLI